MYEAAIDDIRYAIGKLRIHAEQARERGDIRSYNAIDTELGAISSKLDSLQAHSKTNVTGFAEAIDYHAQRGIEALGNGVPEAANQSLYAIRNLCGGETDPDTVPLAETQYRIERIGHYARSASDLLDRGDESSRDAAKWDIAAILGLCDPDSITDTTTIVES